MSIASTNRGLTDFVVRDRRAIGVLTLLYLAVGLLFIRTDYTLNDEGLVTITAANLARHFPLEILFVQKAKPVLTLLYSPFASLGIHGLLYLHLFVTAAAVPMIAAVARSLGYTMPNVAALALAASPGFLLAAPAGLSNADGVLGVTLTLFLLVTRRSDLAAGLVMGTLPWVRHELTLFVALMVVRAALFDRRFRVVLGAAVFPLLYGIAGGFYHHDPIWLIHYPPSTLFAMPGHPMWPHFSASGLLRGLFSLSPLALLVLSVPFTRWQPIERWLLLYAIAWIVIATLMPMWRLANFGFIPRYLLVVAPVIALAVGRVVQAWSEGDEKAIGALVTCAFLAALYWLGSSYADAKAALPVIGVILVALALSVAGRRGLAAQSLMFLIAVGPALGIHTEIPRTELAPYLPNLAVWLRQNPNLTEGPVYTNVPLLAPYLDGAARLPGLDIRLLIGVDQAYDMEHMTSTASGQRLKLHDVLAAGEFNGARAVLPDELSPETIPDGALFVFRHDRRLEMLMPATVWSSHLRELYDRDFRIVQFVRDPAR